MGKRHALAIGLIGLLLVMGWLLFRRSLDPDRRAVGIESEMDGTGAVGGPAAPGSPPEEDGDTAVRDDVVYTPGDVEIFREVVRDARSRRLDTLALGDIMVRVGRRFVGEPYTPHTLDPPGPERLIVNLREFDCVTYVESVLALARVIRDGGRFVDFTEELRRIRYRDGEIDGYPSRLHYFSEWIARNDEKGLLEDITASLGGVADDESIDFMSTHADAYAALDGHPDMVEQIRRIERELSQHTRTYVPQADIGAIADRIRDGDVIAATSSLPGLDVAHTGLAVWVDGRLHLMHAPLVGRELEISDAPLAERILGIDGQDGIMVARPR